MNFPRVVLASLCSGVVLLSACGGSGDEPNNNAAPAISAAEACQSLSAMAIPARDISLATNGARVTSATLQAAAGSGPSATPEYCKVLVKIDSVDLTAPPITAQFNLPTNWNKKVVHFGGAGFDGVLVTAEGAAPASISQATPLASGYVTFGSDGGHSVTTAQFVEDQVTAFLNDEVLINYAGAQLKKTKDVAVALIQARYRESARRVYFAGSSGGGREALIVAQRYPADYDGVISYFPAAGGAPMVLNFSRVSRALAAPGAFPNPAKQALLHSAVISACDGIDGAVDGVIAKPAACNFDVATLRCAGGADTGNTCLSDAQISAMNTMASDLTLPYSLPSGETGIAGYGVYQGVDLTVFASGLGTAAPIAKPVAFVQPGHDWLYDIFYRGILVRDPDADSLAFDPLAPGVYQSRLGYLSTILASNEPNLSAFRTRGGKLIMVHGNDDALIPVGWSSAYYQQVVATMGSSAVDGFMRYYAVPGYGHGSGAFTVDWDSLTALDNWVENGTAVNEPTAVDAGPSSGGRTRPLCRFPAWPKYRGTGDINSAGSFTCETS